MFNDKYGLTGAVLSGRKTQTRRIINPQPKVSERMGMIWKGYASGITSPYGSPSFLKDVYHNFLSSTNYPQCRRCKVGEVVAVAQAYREIAHPNDNFLDNRYEVKDEYVAGWANKLFVCADLMPHKIRITNVHVERLQDISDEDCIAEGVELNPRQYEYDGQKVYFVRNLGHWRGFGCDNFKTPREAYAALIDRISGKGTWDSNPYVFVYEFELIK